MEKRRCWVVYVNTYLTEGRGREVPWHVCKIEATARRLAKGAGVQGSDARVEEMGLLTVDGVPYGPVTLAPPTAGDEAEDEDGEFVRRLTKSGVDARDIKRIICMLGGDNGS